MFLLILFLISSVYSQTLPCTPEMITYIIAQPFPTVTNATCNTNGTITFLGDPVLLYSIDSGANYFSSPIFTNVSPGTYNWVIRFVNTTSCVKADFLTVGQLPDVAITAFSQSPATCSSGWTLSVSTTESIYPLIYSFDNGTTFQSSPIISGNTNYQALIIVRYQQYPTCPQDPAISVSFTVPWGCPSPANCTFGSTFIPDPNNEFEYRCLCPFKPCISCGPNCYINNSTGQYVTIEGQNCDRRYIKLYDDPCCFDCQDCRPVGIRA